MACTDLLAPLLTQLDASLLRDAIALELRSNMTKLLDQATSPLSAIRQEAWAGIVALIERALADGAQSALKLDALLAAVRLEWPLLLTRLHECLLGAAEAPASAASPGSSWAAVSRAVSVDELTAAVQTLQVCCLLHPPARQDCTAALLQLLLGQLQGTAPALHCACLDALLAMQAHEPAAFLAFTQAEGVQQLCKLVKDKATPDRVRGRAVRTLNLLLVQVAPGLLPEDARSAATPAATPAGVAPPEGLDEQQAEVWRSLAAARESVGALLGREARAMLLRRISLADPQSDIKLEQLSTALMLFVEGED